jgi:CheY-like chemotaxis protein
MARVLVIDDHALTRSAIRAILKQAGHEVRLAADGVEGLRALGEEPADVVVCDVFMPRKEGLETIRELRRLPRPPKIVAISGGSDAVVGDFLPFARSLGADRALPKPFEPEALRAAVDELLAE